MKLMKYIKKATAITAAAAISATMAISASAAEDASFFEKGQQLDANGKRIGYTDLGTMNNGTQFQAVYDKIYNACVEAWNSSADYAAVAQGDNFILPLIDDASYQFHPLVAIPVSDFYSGSLNSSAAFSQAYKNFFAIYTSVMNDNPLFYFLDYSAIIGLTQTSDQGIVVVLGVDPVYAKGSDRAAIQAKIKDFYGAAEEKVAGLTSLQDKHAALSKYLIDNMTYAYESDGRTPSTEPFAHTVVGPAVNKAGVCESYARSYELLCNFAGMNGYGIYADGNALNADNHGTLGGHAWNYIKLEDGDFYAQDLTWDDQLTESVANALENGRTLDQLHESIQLHYHDGSVFYYFGRGKDVFFTEHEESTHNSQTQFVNMFLYTVDQIAGVVRPTYDYYVPGDVNNDFTFNMKDLIRLGKYTVNTNTAVLKAVANADGTGDINMADAVYLQKSLLGYENTEPNVDHTNYPTRPILPSTQS